MPAGSCDVTVRHAPLPQGILNNAYTVTGGGNRPPVANDDSATVRQTNTVSIPVLANDTDPDAGDVLHVVSETQPAHGSLTTSTPNVYDYTPDPGYLGEDEFTYTIADAAGATSTAAVHVEVIEAVGTVRATVQFADSGLALGEHAVLALRDDQGVLVTQRCLGPADATVTFDGIPLGSYTVAVADQLVLPPAVGGPDVPPRYAVPAPVPVTLTDHGVTEPVDVSVPVRQLLVGAVDPAGSGVGPVCYRLAPVDRGNGGTDPRPVHGVCSSVSPSRLFTDVWPGDRLHALHHQLAGRLHARPR